MSVPSTQGEAPAQTPAPSKAELEGLEKEIKEQGDKVRQLKSSGAEKVSVSPSILYRRHAVNGKVILCAQEDEIHTVFMGFTLELLELQ